MLKWQEPKTPFFKKNWNPYKFSKLLAPLQFFGINPPPDFGPSTPTARGLGLFCSRTHYSFLRVPCRTELLKCGLIGFRVPSFRRDPIMFWDNLTPIPLKVTAPNQGQKLETNSEHFRLQSCPNVERPTLIQDLNDLPLWTIHP